MVKHMLFFGALLVVVLFFAFGAATARSAEARGADGGLVVAASVEPQRFALERIGGDRISTVVLVPAGADPHTYEPKPSQVAALARADIYMSIGLEFEKAWLGRVLGVNPNLRVVPMNAGLEPADAHDADLHGEAEPGHDDHAEHGQQAQEAEAEHGGHAHHHHGMDPHVWTDPSGMRRMAENALAALVDADPANADFYRANCAGLLKDIDDLDARLHELFADVPESRRVFLVFHPAWGHFAKAYGLTQLAVEVEGKEPGPMELSKIITEAKEHGVRAIFVQPQMSRRTAETVARSLGALVVDADPLAPDWDVNLLSVARAFRGAMK